jgi:hypothetical protein
VLAWQIDGTWQYNDKLVTELEVRFTPDGSTGTRVDLEHRNMERFGEGADALRAALDGDMGWGAELASYIAATRE